MPYTTSVAGTTITASWANASIRDQVVTPFASAAARTSAITVPVEGMVTHLNDTNCLGVYTGSAWSTVGPVHGAATAITTTVTQSGAVAHTATYASYTRVGRLITGTVLLTMSASGTGANAIVIGGFPECAGGVNVIGSGYLKDTSASEQFLFMPAFITSTTVQLRATNIVTSDTYLGSTDFTAALASGDTIQFSFSYHAAADA